MAYNKQVQKSALNTADTHFFLIQMGSPTFLTLLRKTIGPRVHFKGLVTTRPKNISPHILKLALTTISPHFCNLAPLL